MFSQPESTRKWGSPEASILLLIRPEASQILHISLELRISRMAFPGTPRVTSMEYGFQPSSPVALQLIGAKLKQGQHVSHCPIP